MGKPEAYVEQYLVKGCNKLKYLCYKFTSPGHNGVPDRIVICPAGTFFVELKAPNEEPRKLQKAIMAKMIEAGALVRVIDTREGVDAFLDEISKTPPPTLKENHP